MKARALQLVDTNVLVYLYDPRFPAKQSVAERVLREGLRRGRVALPHQALVEFVAATTRPVPMRVKGRARREPLLERSLALLEVEELAAQFPVLYPDEAVLRTATRGAAMYQLSWFDAHLWAYAEVYGLPEILSEDFEHGRRYGSVRASNPFLAAADDVHELPALYDD